MNKQLLEAAKNRNIIPFIGAGFSRNLGIPTWDEVISLIAKKLDWSPEVMKAQGDFLQIAEYYKLEKHGISELRSELDQLFHAQTIDITKSVIHSHLVDLNVPMIYTTNWDCWIEKAYEAKGLHIQPVRNLSDIVKLEIGTPQIVKFHGDFKGSDDDLVFTESSYFNRLDFELPLDIKFRSDILGKVIVFIGYSFSDINTRLLWHKLMKMLNVIASSVANDYPKSYIVSSIPNQLQERLFKSKNIEVINLPGLDPKASLETFLATLVGATKQR